MLLYVGFAVLLMNLVFFMAKWFAPESELLNSFKKTSHFWWTQVVLLLLSLTIISGHFYGLSKAQWYTSPMFEKDSQLYVGEKNGPAILHESFPFAGTPFETEIIIPGSADGKDALLSPVSESGETFEPLVVTMEEGRSPLTISFPESGQWRIDVEYEGSERGSIVLEVK
ncbi:hypothetical protein FZC84_07105 [Rossellomorea vietnamensis]|uniref:Uncharacterized protein n=1 Tax=Rossellomorea vietnamensis TaxID=218284 RepID=A0A5D4MG29_9BACI|nr:hypothetical protein [Rossellomorea vietnamensis]TYS00304.1 hypothetical protein FZC84_07105 [Rossellomorea vietnamensis]